MKEVVLKENKAPTIASYTFIDSFHSAQNSVFYIVCVCKILVGSFPNLGEFKFNMSLRGKPH